MLPIPSDLHFKNIPVIKHNIRLFFSHPVQMGFHRPKLCIQRIAFCLHGRCRRSAGHSPVIENTGDSVNLIRMLRGFQEQIPVLSTIRLRIPAPDLLDQRRAQNRKMGNIISGIHHVHGPPRLIQRIKSPYAVFIDHILVRIKEIQLRLLLKTPNHLEKCIFRQKIIMIQHGSVFSLYHRETLIGIGRDSSILRQILYMDPVILLLPRCKGGRKSLILRTCIGNAQLPVPVALRRNRCDHLIQQTHRRMIYRNHNTDEGTIGKLVCHLPAPDKTLFFLIGIQIGEILFLHPAVHPFLML